MQPNTFNLVKSNNYWLLWGFTLLSLIFFMVFLAPLFFPFTYEDTFLEIKNSPPSFQHWFGTDELGRDVFVRTCFGTKISLAVAFLASLLDLTIGFCWGAVAAFSGSLIDRVMNRLMDILFSIPYLLLTIMLVVVMGSGLISLAVALSLIGWIPMARVVRGQILQVRQMDYYIAAKVIGVDFTRLLRFYVLPNIAGPVLVTLIFTIPSAIFAEAFLSYLGLGLQPPMASLGTMTYDALPSLQLFPWRFFFPALMIVLLIFSLNLIGEGLKQTINNE